MKSGYRFPSRHPLLHIAIALITAPPFLPTIWYHTAVSSSHAGTAFAREPQPAQISEEIFRSGRFIAGEPEIAVSPDGIVTVTVKTARPCAGGEAFLGIFPVMAELNYPVYCVKGKVTLPDEHTVKAQLKLRRLELDYLDINDFRRQQGGQVALRLCLLGEKLHIFDRIFAYWRSPEGRYQRAPALVEGPLLDCVSDSSATVSWQFDQPVSCFLQIEPGFESIEFAQPALRHEVILPHLAARTDYSYSITWVYKGVSFKSHRQSFRTAPPRGADEPFRFAVFCDGRGAYGGGEANVEGVNLNTTKALLNLAYQQSVAFILCPGDLVSGSSSDPTELQDQFRSYKRIIAAVGGRIPIYEGIGNHDRTYSYLSRSNRGAYISRSGRESGEALFAKHFVNPTNAPEPASADAPPYLETVYSFDWGNAHFAMLNNNYWQKGSAAEVAQRPGELQGTLRTEQLEWLENDLRAARKRGLKHLFVAAHEPAFPTGGHSKDAMWWKGERPQIVQMRNRFWRILCRYRVLAAFFGHDHNYSRTLIDSRLDPAFSPPVWQIITGGGGATFYDQEREVPWAEAVQAFYPLPHLCVLEVDGDRVVLNVIAMDGTSVERVALNDRR